MTSIAMPMSIINFRARKSVKEQAGELFTKMGLDMSSALNMFLTKVIETKGIPFMVTTVNGYTPKYEKMILEEIKNRNEYKSFRSVEEMMLDLES